ncbi:DUF2786 domain-containing protein [Smaragdicoccus niigatensis]|uniref:DUF2786 domain-containing protein n=1 Tax=Smaragdicoccus niigatensis TaxID=359359 RepID=UPI000368079C|nr:DUF2786 domain-containing protein [Smaragdicoccus niigatensis]
MGVNNRQRRAEKARKARKQQTTQNGPRNRHDESWSAHELASLALRHLALQRAGGNTLISDADAQFARYADHHQQRAFDDQIVSGVRASIARGWTPLDLHEVSRRRFSAPVVEFVMCVVARESAGRGAVHPDWSAQLSTLSTTHDNGTQAWAARTRLAWNDARDQLIDLLVVLFSLPALAFVLPAPGASTAEVVDTISDIDDRVLRKVRALLVKAESTEFEDEAEALTAKAQQLITTHSIDHVLAAQTRTTRSRPIVRRLWLDAPYLVPKALLVNAVAGSNNCSCVLSKEWGFVTLVGHRADLAATELLATSLLVQATRAMTAAGSHATRHGTSRTRSYRQSFLVAYAERIGERLSEASAQTTTQADAEHGGALLPVLAARAEEVRVAASAIFPELTQTAVRAGDSAGWGAGRAAADLAQLDTRGVLDERAS